MIALLYQYLRYKIKTDRLYLD